MAARSSATAGSPEGGKGWKRGQRTFPVATASALNHDDHLLAVLRYIERNPLRANLVRNAQDWIWSSAAALPDNHARPRPLLDPGPVARPADWLQYVNEPQTAAEVERLRICTQRGRPFGSLPWITQTADRLGLAATLRPLGRPRKTPDNVPLLLEGDAETR